jgi:D-alanyl-D-alanine carboxypeptidase
MRVRLGTFTAGILALGVMMLRIGVANAQLPPMSSIMIDAGSGQILYAQNADQPRYPASLTKLMTLYMLFEALRDHRIALNQLMPVSVHSASVEPVKLGVPPGGRISVEEAILAMVTLSANDAATTAGEFLAGGDETRFGALMTLKAHTLGMNDTVFRNASGLPDPEQVTTAHDVALLARRLIQDFPEDYHYFSTPSFLFHGRVIFNHDNLLKSYPGADGMKTGYTNAAGHNLVTSAVRGGVRLIGVVMAAPSNGYRDRQMAGMLNAGFATELGPATALAAATAASAARAAQLRAGTGPVVPVEAAERPAAGRQRGRARRADGAGLEPRPRQLSEQGGGLPGLAYRGADGWRRRDASGSRPRPLASALARLDRRGEPGPSALHLLRDEPLRPQLRGGEAL